MHLTPQILRRQIFVPFVLLLLGFSRSPSQGSPQVAAADSATILRIENELLQAVGSGDTAVWKKYLDESFLMVSEDGSRSTKEQLLASLHPLPKGYSGEIHILEPALDVRDQVAVLHYVADEHESVYGQQLHTTYATMNVYIRRDGEWRLFSSQVFEIPKTPPRINVPEKILASYVGTYELAEGNTYSVKLDHGVLTGARNGSAPQELLPETENVFFVKSDARGRRIFVKGGDGAMTMRARRNGNDIVWKRRN